MVRRISELGVADQSRFVGSQSQDQLPISYYAADVVAIPSRYGSFGLVAVEAMACGTPVAASRAGGLTYTVEVGVTGFLVPPRSPEAPAASLRAVLAADRLPSTLGQSARLSSERFAWPVVAFQILHVYERLADGHRADRCRDEGIYA